MLCHLASTLIESFTSPADTEQDTVAIKWQQLRTCGPGPRHHLSPRATLIRAEALAWLGALPGNCLHAVVTDPPYGLIEYEARDHRKLRAGRGGVWRIPPAFDGARRRPLPRFTVLTRAERESLREFFAALGMQLQRVLVPGGHAFIASNPLLSTLAFHALGESGLEKRGEVVRLTQTLRGGDRPKGAEAEFAGVSVMARAAFEPWGIFRKEPEGTVAENLRRWGTGGLRRVAGGSAGQGAGRLRQVAGMGVGHGTVGLRRAPAGDAAPRPGRPAPRHETDDAPFKDVIACSPTSRAEHALAPHPSLKPQRFLRQIVRAALPLGTGIVCDPFAGSASTLAAAQAVGYLSLGVERDPQYFRLARRAFPKLAAL